MFSSNATQVTSTAANYIEDCFGTWLYDGNGSTQTIVNNIDLSTKGGLVWIKNRNNVYEHQLTDTVRGVGSQLASNNTNAATSEVNRLTSFNSNGFSMDASARVNGSSLTYASWTFAKQPKFFDVVTWTGTGVNGQVISHSLGVKPSVIICKCTSSSSNWQYNDANDFYLLLNSTAASAGANRDGGWLPQYLATSTTLTTQNNNGNSNVNALGETYVAYLFASNAGGFGLTGTDNVISCGSVTGTGGDVSVNLSYEPQWILWKKSTGATADWLVIDNMRGMPATGSNTDLRPNLSNAEVADSVLNITSTGFTAHTASASTYIYVAIRRGPMKVPTDGTTVYNAIARTGTTSKAVINVGFPTDLFIQKWRASAYGAGFFDKLRGVSQELDSDYTGAEQNNYDPPNDQLSFDNNGITVGPSTLTVLNANLQKEVYWNFRRAPSFFDEVCYTGNGVAGRQITHNLAAVPELMIVKPRNTGGGWAVYNSFNGASSQMYLNLTNSADSGNPVWYNTSPTASVFSVNDTGWGVNDTSKTYVAYLFATCAGVSKVSSYTGNGTTQTIDCGFAGGARFVLIKRTDSTGDWYVYDTARGMTTLTDPYLRLNSSAAETATLGSVTTVSTGFALNSAILAAINASGGSYIFLAIA